MIKNPTSDFRQVPTFWDVVKELPGPSVKMPHRKRGKKDATNNPGIDVAGKLFVQNDNINMAHSRSGST